MVPSFLPDVTVLKESACLSSAQKKQRQTREAPTGGLANYDTSSNSKRWLSHIPLFSRVRYPGIYRDIDAIFHGRFDQGGLPTPDELEYDFEI